ncbi:MAG: Ldh family oxidoreductase [Verrucomicrobia bacterium]|nr:Ldh family oxidoreductase [Verrucomicrobiota bacterium]
MSARHPASTLIAYATALLSRAGLDADKAAAVAVVLTEGDLLGHTTHGLALLAPYLAEIEKGAMTKTGEPHVVADFPAAVTWDGRRLPGPWLVTRALDLAIPRAKTCGTCTVVIRRSHHIACLAAYLKRVTDEGLMVLLSCSDPAAASVAPFGGRREVFTPNPLAAAWPTAGDPVILDVSMSITTNGLTKRLHAEKKPFPGLWALDAAGHPTSDPAALYTKPPGTLLPAGGVDHGHKGYAFALLVEALTGALAGHGRADPVEGWGASVFIQVLVPALFGGAEEFRRQTEHVAAACRATPPRPGFERVRLPGESGLRRRADQLAHGVELYPGILDALAPWTQKLGVTAPASI